jgi:hypothetical protein
MGQLSSGHFDGSGTGLSPGANSRRTIVGTYSFAIQGGGTGSYAIARLNSGARVVGGWVNVAGTPTAVSGTPTIAISIEAANDVISAASILGAPWSTVGKKAITPKVNTPESTSILLTADRDVVVEIASAAINTGVVNVYLDVIG